MFGPDPVEPVLTVPTDRGGGAKEHRSRCVPTQTPVPVLVRIPVQELLGPFPRVTDIVEPFWATQVVLECL
ncbi:hypothetical protein, partial [Rhodococcus wratislaviensis]|uniref:hypothetical protein n=1 Tax=Rhodococcus wratislaviensis TaxID=44752 RepID=UPI001C3F169A